MRSAKPAAVATASEPSDANRLGGAIDIEAGLSSPISQSPLIAAARSVALGKIIAFDFECERIAAIVAAGSMDKLTAVDGLAEIAFANSLSEIHGADVVQAIISQAFIGTGAHKPHE